MIITSKKLSSNAALSVAQVIVSGVLLFFLYRFLLKTLGAEKLGLWSVILASTSIARLSDLGLTASVVKFVASHRARRNYYEAASSVQTIALSLLVLVGGLLVVAYPLISHILTYFLPAESMPDALGILPLALLAFWINSVGGVFQAGLDGCQEARIRNVILILSSVVFFSMAIVLVPRFGIMSLAIAQVVQSLLVVVVSWLALCKVLPELPPIPWQWSKRSFREMFSYSVNFQITSGAAMLIDPLTKGLMSKYGGLSTAAYYEMASQLAIKARALLVSANQVMVPVVAETHAIEPSRVKHVYFESYKAVFFASVVVYSALLLMLPGVSFLWIGRFEPIFVVFGSILAVTYFVNNIEVPAHFDNLGTGRLGWNTIANVGMAVANVILGTALGQMFGGIGVGIAVAIAIMAGSLLVLFVVHHRYGFPTVELVPRTNRLFATILLPAAVLLTAAEWKYYSNGGGSLTVAVIAMGMWCALLVVAFSLHPYRVLLSDGSWKVVIARDGRK